MTRRNLQGDAPSGSDPDPYGDDQGTRVGHPSTPHRDNVAPSGKTGASGEQETASGADSGADGGGSGARPGSARLDEHQNEHQDQHENQHRNEHKPGYGGEGGAPRTSSDQR